MVVGVYDYDFFHYPSVIPNLECAKLVAWRRKKNDITVFTDQLNTSMYTKFYIRKDYDDGLYLKELTNENVEYGGRAFSNEYAAFPQDMEEIVPDFSIYEKYSKYYGNDEQFKNILRSTHLRLGTTPQIPFDRLLKQNPKIILHDYDLASVPNAYDILTDACNTVVSGRPITIGNKFPIQIYTFDELKKWLLINPSTNLFFIQYNGLLTDEELIYLVHEQSKVTRVLLYNIGYGCASEDDFMVKVLPKIYRQILFLRRNEQKILLYNDNQFLNSPILSNLIALLQMYANNFEANTMKQRKQTLYGYCSCKSIKYLRDRYRAKIMTTEEMREVFQYVRVHNYEVFDMFYSLFGVYNKGDKLIDER